MNKVLPVKTVQFPFPENGARCTNLSDAIEATGLPVSHRILPIECYHKIVGGSYI